MGGYGSGRQFGKRTTNQVTSITVKELGAADRLHGSVRFRYSLSGKPVEHTVLLTQTPCHYGGVRHWFRCGYCQRRVGVLYLSGGQCGCRHCFKLAYKSERESRHYRLFRKADKIRVRLGWGAGIAFPDGAKPKGMHWKTFNRMKTAHDITVQRIWGISAQLCDMWAGRLQNLRDRMSL
jgi:hypothetical protein